MANKKVTPIQLAALKALQSGIHYDPTHRPKSSLERLRKKGFVMGSKRLGWKLTDAGEAYLSYCELL